MQTLSDEQLIAVSNDADAGAERRQLAVDELFGRYQTRVALWCFRVVREREWAADLAQEVFLRALRGLAGFRGDAKFSTWLYTVARNHCFNAIQSKVTRAEEPPASGCEHFGISTLRNPTQITYRWLVADPQNPGQLIPYSVAGAFGAPPVPVPVPIPQPIVNIVPPAQPAGQPAVDFQIQV
ncbi:MAG: sigma-70 family RNA polymerase sigma factor, partial [Acidobacteriota bacterium]|nr:sigma-70 family RNA polymerase sigma factor [Acidobacteriota bacterium]